jgi:hypothetical protein
LEVLVDLPTYFAAVSGPLNSGSTNVIPAIKWQISPVPGKIDLSATLGAGLPTGNKAIAGPGVGGGWGISGMFTNFIVPADPTNKSTRMHRPTFSVSATHSAWTACFDGLGARPNACIICGDGNREICRLIWFAAIGVPPQLSRAQIGKTLRRSPEVARRARAPLLWPPVITYCGFTARPAAQRTILIRILGRHFDAAVISLIPALSCRCRPSAPFAELVFVKGRLAELRE